MEIPEKLLKPYDPKETEARIYALWEESGYFNPDNLPLRQAQGETGDRKETFSMIMPPTNANGSLHAGHGLVMTIEDIITRYKRMRGFKTLWLPGLDHAGFETQVVYEKKLEKEGRSRFDMEPKQLYKKILDFTLTNSENIKSQIRSMGASCDWSREKFTLDPQIIETVYSTFKKLSDDGLLYRGKRIVSWCTKHQTSFSDLEIKDEERTDKFYYLKYGPFVIGTSRPETKFGDKYVVMHPNDERYSDYKDGQQLDLEWVNGPITATIIKDDSIDMEFGTGVMTITPWHDQADFDIAKRHNLEMEQVIDLRGKLLPIAGEFAGLNISKAREAIIEKLKSKGLVEKIEDNYKHIVHTCYKCNTVIEPQILPQWFIKMKPLAEKALEKIKAGEIEYLPDHFQKITLNWLENINDWNISRQIVWGIPIPAKICDSCGEGFADLENSLIKCKKCESTLRVDTDTFDTWFSSGQWPFASLGYPKSEDFKTYFPTDILETAGDLVFFWLARMVMLSLYVTDKVPFKKVYIHGMVLDAKGQKMSKSKGNVINPLDLTEKFGTDAFRLGMIIGNTPGTSLSLSVDKIRAYRNFSNKLWNITRFVLGKENAGEVDPKLKSELDEIIKDVTSDMDNYRFYLAGEKLYHYVWHRFADEIIEESKEKPELNATLYYLLENSLKLLHPFMPFVTEELWAIINNTEYKTNRLLLIESWPNENKYSL